MLLQNVQVNLHVPISNVYFLVVPRIEEFLSVRRIRFFPRVTWTAASAVVAWSKNMYKDGTTFEIPSSIAILSNKSRSKKIRDPRCRLILLLDVHEQNSISCTFYFFISCCRTVDKVDK